MTTRRDAQEAGTTRLLAGVVGRSETLDELAGVNAEAGG